MLELPYITTHRIISECRYRRRQKALRAAYYRNLRASDPQLVVHTGWFGRFGPVARGFRRLRGLWK